MKAIEVSIVVPALNEEANLEALTERLDQSMSSMTSSWELIIVDDGSIDSTWEVISKLAKSDFRVSGLRLSRNFGHQVALSAGLDASGGRHVVTLDADLQHPPELIPDLIERLNSGYDVATAVRGADDEEGVVKRFTADLFYRFFNFVTGFEIPPGGADFRAMKRPVVEAITMMPERRRFLRGMTRWVGFKQCVVEYERAERGTGTSEYSVRRMFALSIDALMSFTARPLRWSAWLGLIVAVLGMIYAVIIILGWALGSNSVPGWTSVIITVLILGGVQLTSLGIIGQYLSRVYEEVKARPLYLIRQVTPPKTLTEDSRER